MTRLTFAEILEVLDAFISGRSTFVPVRDLIFRYYEAEGVVEPDDKVAAVLPVLAPYLEYEEAFGDESCHARMVRLSQVLRAGKNTAEHVIFALEFDQIQALQRKLVLGRIQRPAYEEQLRNLSPSDFDARRVASWGAAHAGLQQLDVDRLS